jgi:hypothetical protein
MTSQRSAVNFGRRTVDGFLEDLWKKFLINSGWIFDNERSDQREQVGN